MEVNGVEEVRRFSLKAEAIKEHARQLGADLVGICSAADINANPPDPRWPQTAERIWKECRSLVVLAQRLPWGMFQMQDRLSRQYLPHLVLGRLDGIALRLSYYIEAQGFYAIPVPLGHTDTDLKRGAYGSLSLRHVAMEAGLGTLGLNLSLLTPEYGPRVYVTAVMTDAELAPDDRLKKRLCLGVSCGRCLMVCPADAVEHWGLNKRNCSAYAMQYGVPALLSHADKFIDAETREQRRNLIHSLDTVNYLGALSSGTGAYAGCPRCLEVCPVGEDYAPHLKDRHAQIPERTEAKEMRWREMRQAEQKGEVVRGLEVSQRWIGEKE
jgi:epoxyqueuosine reductase QueG